MTANPVVWFEIYVTDLKRARAFYEKVLGVKLDDMPMEGMGEGDGVGNIEMVSFPMQMEGAGAAGALVRMEGFPVGGNSTLVYFSSEDCAIEAARVPGAGGRIQREKTPIGPYGFIALAVDTEGNMFGIHSQK